MDFQAQRDRIEASKKVIHLMHGKEEKLHLGKTKTGCRLTGLHPEVSQWVYLDNSKHVNCPDCIIARDKIHRMQGKD